MNWRIGSANSVVIVVSFKYVEASFVILMWNKGPMQGYSLSGTTSNNLPCVYYEENSSFVLLHA